MPLYSLFPGADPSSKQLEAKQGNVCFVAILSPTLTLAKKTNLQVTELV
jgi:hypothetical protein